MRIACSFTTFLVSQLLLQKCFKNRIMAKSLSKNFVVAVQSLSHVQLCDVINHSTSGFSVHLFLPEFIQIQVHWISDAIQTSHPLLSPSPLALGFSQYQGLFQGVSSFHQFSSVQLLSTVWLFATPLTHIVHGLIYSPWNSPGQNTGIGSLSLLQGIFLTQQLKPGLPHCRILYQLSHKGSLRILKWVAYPFSYGSSWPRNQTRVSCIAGEFFTSWATRKVQVSFT